MLVFCLKCEFVNGCKLVPLLSGYDERDVCKMCVRVCGNGGGVSMSCRGCLYCRGCCCKNGSQLLNNTKYRRRNLGDSHIRGIAKTGGVICIGKIHSCRDQLCSPFIGSHQSVP